MNKATWTGLQRGSSMSRFFLADSLVAVGSSVLLYVMGLTEKNRKKIRGSFRLSLAISSIRRDVTPRALRVSFRFYPLSFRPPPFGLRLLVTFTPFSPLSSLCTSLCFSLSLSLSFSPHPLCFPLTLLNFSSRFLPIHLTVYLSICLSLEAPRVARATCTAATLKERCQIGRHRCPDERRQPIPEDADGDAALFLPLFPSLFLSLSFSLSLSLSRSLSLSGDECRRGWRRAAAKDALSLSLSLSQPGATFPRRRGDRQNVRRT